VAHSLAVQASRLLGYPVAISHEVFPLPLGADLLGMVGQDRSPIAAKARLGVAVQSRDRRHRLRRRAVVAIQGIEIYPLEDGYLVLIDRKTNFAFMAEVVRVANTHLGKEGTV
jgi:hypothetical protein